jgi:hypothetical protein
MSLRLNGLARPFAHLGTLSAGLRRLLPALLALAASAELFAYAGYGAADRAAAAQALALADRLRDDDAPLSRWLHELNAAAARPGAAVPADGTEFLRALDGAATQAGARITRLAPRLGDPALLDVEMAAGFADFVRFAAAMERLGGTFRGVQVRRADASPDGAGAGAGHLVVAFALEAPQHPAPAPRGTGAGQDAASASATLPDPFAPPVAVAGVTIPQHHLTGITRLGTGRVATIDGRDYGEGDALGDATIATIRDDAVQLASGGVRYWLRFAAWPQ